MLGVPEDSPYLCIVYKFLAIIVLKFYMASLRKSLQLALLYGKITVGGCTEHVIIMRLNSLNT